MPFNAKCLSRLRLPLLAAILVAVAFGGDCLGQNVSQPGLESRKTRRVLLIGQGPDNHPWGTHEYLAGMKALAECLQPVKGIQTVVVAADGDWKEGPELIDTADGIVLFVSEGAKWIHQNKARLNAFQRHAQRGGGLMTLHWGMGCKDAKFIPEYLKLFGGCHGGPDRRYKVINVAAEIANASHPVMRGMEAFQVHDEFYYTLKFVESAKAVTPLLKVPVDGNSYTVAWSWERPDQGRSFGFSGCHFHENWKLEPYRRLLTQAVLWTLKKTPPNEGLSLKISDDVLQHPRPKPKKTE